MRSYNSDFPAYFSDKVGSVDPNLSNRSSGKKVMEWSFKAIDGDDKGGDNGVPTTSVKIDVNLLEQDNKLVFTASCNQQQSAGDHLFKMPEMTSSDIDQLHKMVSQFFDQNVAAISKIKWEDWLEVSVRGERSEFEDSVYSAMGANLKVIINRLKCGTHPKTGKLVTISKNGYLIDFPKSATIDNNDGNTSTMFGRENKESSYIKDTPENMAALTGIVSRMEALKYSLAKFLSQDKVEDSLIDIENSLPMLSHKEDSNERRRPKP